MGAGRVFGIDKVADRLAKAAEFGSEPLDCSAVNDIAAEILRLCPPGVNIAITAVGSRHPKSWTESLGVSASSEDNIAAICNAIRACRKGTFNSKLQAVLLLLLGNINYPLRTFP